MNDAILLWFQSLRSPVLNQIVLLFTNTVWFIVLLGVCLLIPRKTRKLGFAVLLGLGLSLTCSTLLKMFVREPRPFVANPLITRVGPVPGGSSFPSSHSTAAFSLFWMLLFQKNRYWWVGLIYAVFIGLSRLYLGVHYPTDVLGGIIVSLVVCFLVSKGIDYGSSKIHSV